MATDREPLGAIDKRFWVAISAVTADRIRRWVHVGSILAGVGAVLALLLEVRVLRHLKLFPIAGGALYAGVGFLSWAGAVSLCKRHAAKSAIDSPGGASPEIWARRARFLVPAALLFLIGIAGVAGGAYAVFVLTADSLGF